MSAEAAAGQRGQGAATWAKRLTRVESRNVTYLAEPPPFWTSASGTEVRDAEGSRYLDLSGAFGVAFAGHAHPLVVERIREQAGRLVHAMGDVHPPTVKVEFLEALSALLPWESSRAILGLSGADAVEAALKTAQLATGRPGVIAFEGAYHGLTLGALAATGREHFRQRFVERLARHVEFVPFPESEMEAPRALDQVARLLAGAAGAPVGALLAEPIQGRAGVRIPPPGFLAEVARLARAEGALFVADEVLTGMGRTGALLGCEHEGVRPDLVCLGKALGGGVPISACVGPSAVMDAWPGSTGEAIHTSTFLGHPLGCAAGLGFLAALEAEDLVGRARRGGRHALAYLKSALEGCDRVLEVRGRGLLIGIELAADGGSEPAVGVARKALRQGVIVLPAGVRGEVVELVPPATVAASELERGLEEVVAAVRSTVA